MTSRATQPTQTDGRIDRRTLMRFAAVVWLSFGVAQLAQSYVLARATGRVWTLAGSLGTGMPWWLSWLVLTPVIASIAERFPFTGKRHWRSLGAHVVTGILVSTVHLIATGWFFWFTNGQYLGIATSAGNQIQRFFGNFFLEAVITYAGATCVLVAFSFARAMRDERVARARLEAEASALEALVTKARLEALSMELNPHFLFNTLSAISGLIAQDRRDEARDVIRRLGDLLRATLERGNSQFTSVAREVELLQGYLFIQQVRFSDRLHVGLDVGDSARDCLVPSMLLQPLVENAIRHGVEPKEGRGDVRIQIERVDGSLNIVIGDSGVGFLLNESGRPAREGIGITNTRARLEHLYGSRASLLLRNRRDGGAEAVVTLPTATNGAARA